MKNKAQKIKNIFIKKMIVSSIAQLLILGLLIIFARNYINHTQINTISDNLLIKDQYTIDQIGSYQLLGATYALDLELHNLGDMRKLDSIKLLTLICKSLRNLGKFIQLPFIQYFLLRWDKIRLIFISYFKQDGLFMILPIEIIKQIANLINKIYVPLLIIQ